VPDGYFDSFHFVTSSVSPRKRPNEDKRAIVTTVVTMTTTTTTFHNPLYGSAIIPVCWMYLYYWLMISNSVANTSVPLKSFMYGTVSYYNIDDAMESLSIHPVFPIYSFVHHQMCYALSRHFSFPCSLANL
jgi:hypothetical protein